MNTNKLLLKLAYIILLLGIFNSIELYLTSPLFTINKELSYLTYRISDFNIVNNLNIIKYNLVPFILILCLIQYSFNSNNIYLLCLLLFLIYIPSMYSYLYIIYQYSIFPKIFIPGVLYFIFSFSLLFIIGIKLFSKK